LLREWEKEQRKTNKDTDGQCETRKPCRKRHGPDNGPGYYQKQKEVETSCKNLIVGEHLTEEEKEEKRTLTRVGSASY